MWKNFGFYLPDSEFLTDPEGLIKYLVRFLSHRIETCITCLILQQHHKKL